MMTFAFAMTGQLYMDVRRQYQSDVDTLIGTSDDDCLITEDAWQAEAVEWLKRLHTESGSPVKPDWVYEGLYDAALKMASAIRASGR